MGSQTFSQTFTVTNFITGVDMVLGMTWLEQVNPLTHWGSHTLYVGVHGMLYPIIDVPGNEDTKIGTMKHIEVTSEEDQSAPYTHSLENWLLPNFGIMLVTKSSGVQRQIANTLLARQEMTIYRPLMMISRDHHSFQNGLLQHLVAYNSEEYAKQ